MTTIQTEVITPENRLFSGEAEGVIVPGEQGEFGVLPNHSPLISILRPGVIDVRKGTRSHQFFVQSGYVEVTESRCAVLAEKATDLEFFDLAKAKKQLQDAKDALDEHFHDDDKAIYEENVDYLACLVAFMER